MKCELLNAKKDENQWPKENDGKCLGLGVHRNPRSVKAKPIFERLVILHIKVIKYLLQNVSLLFPRHMSLPQILAADASISSSSIPHIVSIPILYIFSTFHGTNIYEWHLSCS